TTGGECTECDAATNLCKKCAVADKWEPNELGSCSQKTNKCTQIHLQCISCDNPPTTCKECNPGWHVEGKVCAIDQETPSIFQFCDETVNIIGCTQCSSNNRSICVACDTKLSYDQSPSEGVCKCKDGFTLTDGKCVEKQVECTSTITGCLKCRGSAPSRCALCDESKGFSSEPSYDGKCSCSQQYAVIENNACVFKSGCADNLTKIGCYYCGNDPNNCQACDMEKGFEYYPSENKCDCSYEGYIINDQGNCVAPTSNCNESLSLTGCLKCDNSTNVCLVCDEAGNYNPEPNNGICNRCKQGFTLRANGECLLPLSATDPVFDPTKSDIRFLSDTYAKPSEDGKVINVVTNDNLNQANRVYVVELKDSTEEVDIENTLDNFGIMLTKDKLTIAPKDNNQKCEIFNLAENPDLTLPLDCEGLSFWNFRNIKLTPKDNAVEGDMKIGKITADDDSLDINTARNVIFNLIDLYGSEAKVERNTAGAGGVIAKNINVQQACQSELTNINITKALNLLQGSTVKFNNVNFQGARINIYNFESEDPTKPLMKFAQTVSQEPSQISVFQSEEDKILEEDTIVLVDEPSSTFSEDECKEWANKVSGGDYNKKECIQDPTTKNWKLLVKREKEPEGKKKNKLSGGAIAGIVIACVVVVAAIIALLVYFLVIKKKNEDTTSTQGDSSIAI
ncbi:hypothetical protein M9Y10_026984, partial [Tritrichomonas musculus]